MLCVLSSHRIPFARKYTKYFVFIFASLNNVDRIKKNKIDNNSFAIDSGMTFVSLSISIYNFVIISDMTSVQQSSGGTIIISNIHYKISLFETQCVTVLIGIILFILLRTATVADWIPNISCCEDTTT